MRYKYYRLTLRQMRFKKAFVVFCVIILFILLISFAFSQKVSPIIKTLCEANARYIAIECTEQAVAEEIENITYNSLIDIERDSNGKVTALNANVMQMNKISNSISTKIQDKILGVKTSYVHVPIATIIGSGIFSGYGPKVAIKISPSGNVNVNFKSEFESAGINQTRHRIYLEITSKVMIIAPFYSDSQEYVSDITVAETVIVSDTPSTYYSISGIDGLQGKDTLNILE